MNSPSEKGKRGVDEGGAIDSKEKEKPVMLGRLEQNIGSYSLLDYRW